MGHASQTFIRFFRRWNDVVLDFPFPSGIIFFSFLWETFPRKMNSFPVDILDAWHLLPFLVPGAEMEGHSSYEIFLGRTRNKFHVRKMILSINNQRLVSSWHRLDNGVENNYIGFNLWIKFSHKICGLSPIALCCKAKIGGGRDRNSHGICWGVAETSD